MKMFASLALAMFACASSTPPSDVYTVKVEDIAFTVFLDAETMGGDVPVVGMFAGIPQYACLAVMHADTSISLYDLNGLIGYDPIFPPLAYNLHYTLAAGPGVYETCYLNRKSIAVWTKTNCAGLTDEECFKKHLRQRETAMRFDPPHLTNPTCP